MSVNHEVVCKSHGPDPIRDSGGVEVVVDNQRVPDCTFFVLEV